MSPSDDRVTVIEIALAHQQRAVEEMSDLIRQQAEQIDRLTRTLELVVRHLTTAPADESGPPEADVPPPHW